MAGVIAFDVRCLQDIGYRDRGVGRLGANLVRSARAFVSRRDLRRIGIVDPSLPALDDRVRIHLDEVRPGGDLPEDADATWFVQLSPMTHDPLFAARMLDGEGVFRAAVVHDFIPLSAPQQYLPTLAHKFDYHAKLQWLARHDHFFPNSNHTKSELVRLLGIAADRITVSPPPVDPAFIANGTSEPSVPRHILVVGGADRRKNVDCAIGAHANSRIGRKGNVPLLVLGGYPPWWQDLLRRLYRDEGGREGQLKFLDYVSDEELGSLYRNAICVVAPSRDEGFSIPVVEGMAVGTPVLASEISAHRELVENRDYMFGPEDYLRLAYLMDHVATEPAFRARMISDQRNRWQRFRADEVARAFWANMQAHAPQPVAAPAIGGHRPKIAVFGPLPPDRSGVADYTAATFRELGKLAEVHAFTPTQSPAPIEGAASIAPISAMPYLSKQFDRCISVMGNSHFHIEAHRLLMRFGGACIEHDNRLLGFYRMVYGEARTTQLAERELKRPLLPGELNRWLSDEATLEATFLGEIAAQSNPMFVHSRGTARLVRERFGTEPRYLPFSVYRTWHDEELAARGRAHARSRLKMPKDEIAIVTLGYVAAAKAPVDCVWALDVLRGWGIPAKLYFVGEIATDMRPLRALCDELELVPHVRFVSEYVSEADYRHYLLAADVAVQLRTHLLGGLSGAILDCIAVGLPTVANADLAEAMEAPGYVFRVPDRPSPILIAEALATAAESRSASAREEERRAYCDVHSFREYTARLMAGLWLDAKPFVTA